MARTLDTVQIVDARGGYLVINRRSFDPKRHKLYEPDAKPEGDGEPEKPEGGTKPESAPKPQAGTNPEGGEASDGEPEDEIDATDGAASLAEKEGVDLAEVTGTGKDGRILIADVQAVIDAREAAAEGEGDTD